MIPRIVLRVFCVLSVVLLGECFFQPAQFTISPRVSSGVLSAQCSSVCERMPTMAPARKVAAPATKTVRTRRPNGYWKVFENVEAELMQISEKLGTGKTMPTESQLRASGLSSLSDAIVNMGGFAAVAARVGLQCSKPKGYWQDCDNVLTELQDFLNLKEKTTLPTQAELRKAGRTDLISAMQIHGGMKVFAEQLNMDMAPAKYSGVGAISGVNQWPYFEAQMRKFVRENGQPGVLPTMSTMKHWGRDDLVMGVSKHGGPERVAAKMQLAFMRETGGQAWELVGKEVRALAAQLGKPNVMPSAAEFASACRLDLFTQVEKRGIEVSAKLLGLRMPGAPVPRNEPVVVKSRRAAAGSTMRTAAGSTMRRQQGERNSIETIVRASVLQPTPNTSGPARRQQLLTRSAGAKPEGPKEANLASMRERFKQRFSQRQAPRTASALFDIMP